MAEAMMRFMIILPLWLRRHRRAQRLTMFKSSADFGSSPKGLAESAALQPRFRKGISEHLAVRYTDMLPRTSFFNDTPKRYSCQALLWRLPGDERICSHEIGTHDEPAGLG